MIDEDESSFLNFFNTQGIQIEEYKNKELFQQLKETSSIHKEMLKDKMNFLRANEAFVSFV